MQIPKQFHLGAASSAWQTEGWSGKKDGQDSYLDDWYKHEFFVWHNGYGPNIATDFMNRYREDIDLMKKIGLESYRTSINWSRFFIDHEKLLVDEEYAEHINNVIDALIAAGIRPMIALEHYELPQNLQDKFGGWNSRKVVDLYVEYAKICFERFGDRVKDWFTFNEPIVPQTRVYLDGIRYPHTIDPKQWMQWNFHKVLATAKVVKAFHELKISGRIGIIHNWEIVYPRSNSYEGDLKAAHICDLFANRLYLDPLVNGNYSLEFLDLLKENQIMFDYQIEDLALINSNPVDYVGINLYKPTRVKERTSSWNDEASFSPTKYYEEFSLPGKKFNFSRGWEIYPPIMYDIAQIMKKDYHNIPWFISESGMGIENEAQFKMADGTIEDSYRIDFISEHLYWLIKAVNEGANCEGYMLWAFTDNVSPMNAFKNRYGLIEIDLEKNLARRMKKSAYWYQNLIKTRELPDETKFAYNKKYK